MEHVVVFVCFVAPVLTNGTQRHSPMGVLENMNRR